MKPLLILIVAIGAYASAMQVHKARPSIGPVILADGSDPLCLPGDPPPCPSSPSPEPRGPGGPRHPRRP